MVIRVINNPPGEDGRKIRSRLTGTFESGESLWDIVLGERNSDPLLTSARKSDQQGRADGRAKALRGSHLAN